ncbi:MAG TPA: hypothetical protein VE959_11100 [Bryobacteraceae bacterium]|nr:hypothetical protein [Bryobacteraceae bacterium]
MKKNPRRCCGIEVHKNKRDGMRVASRRPKPEGSEETQVSVAAGVTYVLDTNALSVDPMIAPHH